MKKLVVILFCQISLTTFCQNYFEIESTDPKFFKSNQNTILVSFNSSTFQFVGEIDLNGQFIWKDSIALLPGGGPVYNRGIIPSLLNDEYICYYERYLYSVSQPNDEKVISIIKFSNSTQEILTHQIDTLFNYFTILNPHTDSTILYLQAHWFLGGTPVSLVAGTLKNDFSYNLISPSDTIKLYEYPSVVHFSGSHFLFSTLMSSGYYIYRNIYQQDITLDGAFLHNTDSMHCNGFNRLFGRYGQDSIYYFLIDGAFWKIVHFDDSLNTISSDSIIYPIYYDEINDLNISAQIDNVNDQVVINQSNIYVLGRHDGMGFSKYVIYKFDMEMNLICEIPINSYENIDKKLLSINDNVYLKVPYLNVNKYFKIEDCDFSLQNSDLSSNLKDITFYPNPTSDYVTFNINKDAELDCIVYDLNGKILFSKILNQKSNIIDLSSFQQGIYIIQISSDEEFISSYIVKQ